MQSLSEIVANIKQYYTGYQQILSALTGLFGGFGAINVYIMYIRGDKRAPRALINLVIGVMVVILGMIVFGKIVDGSFS